jgi:integrase
MLAEGLSRFPLAPEVRVNLGSLPRRPERCRPAWVGFELRSWGALAERVDHYPRQRGQVPSSRIRARRTRTSSICVLAYAGPRPQDAVALEWPQVRDSTLLFEQKNVDGEIVAGQKTGRPPRTTPLWASLRDDLVAWQLRSGRRRARPTGYLSEGLGYDSGCER